MLRKVLKNEPLVFGNGSQIRAWLYVDDMVEGLLKCQMIMQLVNLSI